jgi:arsenate reductase (thioredoxin)
MIAGEEPMRIELLYTPDCPNLHQVRVLLRETIQSLGLDLSPREIKISGPLKAEEEAFPGSPTIRIDGRDLEPESAQIVTSGSRIYKTGAGVPEGQLLKFKIARAAGLKTVLFICTGNAVRSQMAEALVNHFLQGRWAAFSAGFLPAGISPPVVKALKEIGIDAARQPTKHLDLFNGLTFDRVITLCSEADRMCTFYPAYGNRVHLPYTDPLTLSTFGLGWKSLFRKLRDDMRAQLIPYLEAENV